MKDTTIGKIIAQIHRQVASLIDEHQIRIFGSKGSFEVAQQASLENDPAKKFSFPVAMRTTISPTENGNFEVETTIGYNVRTKETKTEIVRTGRDFADEGIDAAQKEKEKK